MNNIDENFNVCEIGNIIYKVKGLQSNSSSPTDTWIVNFKDDITYDYKNLKTAFLKIFIDPDKLFNNVESLALKYELNIYKFIINNIIKYKICPNFVKYLAIGEKCSYSDLLKILTNNLYDPLGVRVLDIDECTKNLNRNLYYIFNELKNRPAIQNNSLKSYSSFSDKTYEYNIILTENMEDSMTLNKWLNNYSNKPAYDLEFFNIIFQIAVACYVMSLSKLVHNDLHSSNIFIKDLGVETTFIYNINSKEFVIKTRYQPLIYDFDRGYVEKLGKNPLLTYNLCNKNSQCNIFIENKDIIKIFCYVYKYVRNSTKDIILKLLSDTYEYRENIKNTYDLKSSKDGLKYCFLQYLDDFDYNEKSIPIEWYSNFNNNMNIISNIANYIPIYTTDLVDINNIFTFTTEYFKPDGDINIKKIKFKEGKEVEEKEEKDEEEEEEEVLSENSDLEDFEPTLSDLHNISNLLRDDEDIPSPISLKNSETNSDFIKKMENILKHETYDLGDGSGNNKNLDNFIMDFSRKIIKLKKFEFGDPSFQCSKEHYNIFNSLFETLLKRKKYAFDYNLWEELYYHSIFFYKNVDKIGNIPTILVTKHNHILPFYMRHNIGEVNTTFLHFDTHPDMNIIKNNINLPEYNKQYLETKNDEYIKKAEDIVWDIGAAISGVVLTTGIQNFIWAMPEWIPDHFLKTTYFIGENKKSINLYSNDPKIEDDDLVDLTYTNRFKNSDKPERNYIKMQTGNQSNEKIISKLVKEIDTYILDIDLDYFVCNGQKLKKKSYYEDQYDVSSTHRTQNIYINQDNPRDFYYKSDNLIKFEDTLVKEIKFINKRIRKFLSLIRQLKNKGITPSHISICDSTNIEFNLCYKCNTLSNGYVPLNLALIVHNTIFNGLKEIFE